MEDRELAGPGPARLSRRTRRGVVALCTLLAVAAGAALPVVAARILAVEDPNDTDGLLDVHEVRFRDPSGEPPSWTVITFNDWTARTLWDRGYVLVSLDTRSSPASDYYALVLADRRGLRASLWRDRDGAPDRRLFSVPVRKRGDRGVEVGVPLRRLDIGPHRALYRWSVTTLFIGGACHRTCVDAAPDDSMIEQPLPSPSASPS
jgi:hypothetical protein